MMAMSLTVVSQVVLMFALASENSTIHQRKRLSIRAQLKSLKEDVAALKNHKTNSRNRDQQQYSFHAWLSEPFKGKDSSTVHPYSNHVRVNDGHAFNARDGVFIVPVSGTYYFYATLVSLHNSKYLDSGILKNGWLLTFVDSRRTSQPPRSVTLQTLSHCDVGDEVYVSVFRKSTKLAQWRTTFSGFLLYSI